MALAAVSAVSVRSHDLVFCFLAFNAANKYLALLHAAVDLLSGGHFHFMASPCDLIADFPYTHRVDDVIPDYMCAL